MTPRTKFLPPKFAPAKLKISKTKFHATVSKFDEIVPHGESDSRNVPKCTLSERRGPIRSKLANFGTVPPTGLIGFAGRSFHNVQAKDVSDLVKPDALNSNANLMNKVKAAFSVPNFAPVVA